MKWLLLMHQIPPRPVSLRLRVWRRLQRVGAVALKNSVWALPVGEGQQEDFEWIRREIEKGGGEATIVKAELIEGTSDAKVKRQFVEARNAEYAELLKAARSLGRRPGAELARLRRRLEEIRARDPFDSPGYLRAQRALGKLERAPVKKAKPARGYQGRVWVTRKRVFVDRMACAWLIERFIDRKPTFRFVEAEGFKPAKGELRFDMFEGEFTHEGDRCSFEVMAGRFCAGDRALAQIAQIIHDLDVKDDKFGRDEAPGLLRMLTGIREGQPDDEARIARAGAVFDDLYSAFSGAGT